MGFNSLSFAKLIRQPSIRQWFEYLALLVLRGVLKCRALATMQELRYGFRFYDC